MSKKKNGTFIMKDKEEPKKNNCKFCSKQIEADNTACSLCSLLVEHEKLQVEWNQAVQDTQVAVSQLAEDLVRDIK